MRSTSSLPAPPQPATASLTWFGRVLGDDGAGGDRLGEGEAAGLGDADGGADVALEEHPLDGDGVGAQLGEQGPELALELGEPFRYRRVDGGVRRTPTATARASRPPARRLDAP